MEKEKLKKIIELHKKWLNIEEGGERADLSDADLSDADLRDADLRYAVLSNADLNNADLSNADLRYANLRYAVLSYAYCSNADLRYANLRNANLRGADLNWANTESVTGITVYATQVNTTRKNNKISYFKELDIWTTGCFQGTKEEILSAIEKTHADNEFLKSRYERAIEYIEREVEFDEKLEG